MEILNRVLFGSFTVLHAIIAVAVIVVARVVWMKVSAPKEAPLAQYRVRSVCGACRWAGSVSGHQARCPKCGGALSG